MNCNSEFLTALNCYGTADELAVKTVKFLMDQKLLSKPLLIKQRNHPSPFSILYRGDDSFSFEQWKKEFGGFRWQPGLAAKNIQFQDHYYCIPQRDFKRQAAYLVLDSQPIDSEAISLIDVWNLLLDQLEHQNRAIMGQMQCDLGNITAQVIHDIESLLNLTEQLEQTVDLKKRIEYQKNVNKQLLFYIREPEIITDALPLKQVILSSLSLLGGEKIKLAEHIADKPVTIELDAELFSRAFNSIVKNALQAVGGNLDDIFLAVDSRKSGSPLLTDGWIVIEVHDKGPSIAEDFLMQVETPFFTTSKNEGSAGFGLTNAKKIIEAHGGFVGIESNRGNGTTVSIFLKDGNEL